MFLQAFRLVALTLLGFSSLRSSVLQLVQYCAEFGHDARIADTCKLMPQSVFPTKWDHPRNDFK